jgi:hypothetical protein
VFAFPRLQGLVQFLYLWLQELRQMWLLLPAMVQKLLLLAMVQALRPRLLQ